MLVTLDPNTDDLIKTVLGAAFEVSHQLGHGFLEKVYQRALILELGSRGLPVAFEVPLEVAYKGQCVGTYIADILVGGCIIVELKAVEALLPAHIGQLLNYLRAAALPVGLLLNFGRPKLEYRRLLHRLPAT